jgi:protein-tyrosine-phosphatase
MNILVLCTGNSARSILLECILSQRSGGRFIAFSAGSKPAGKVHPQAYALLVANGYRTDGLASKSWDVFAAPDAPKMDIVITVCGSAAAETCPYWPGAPVRTHWGVDDPAAASKPDQARAFQTAYDLLLTRAQAFVSLDLQAMPPATLTKELARIGTL